MPVIFDQYKEELIKICKKLKIKKLYAFGSAVNLEKYRTDSDIDLLISFEEDLTPEEYSANYFQLQYKLRKLFNRDLDIVTERSLSNPYFIESINKHKVLLYKC